MLDAQGLIASHETKGRTVAPDGAGCALRQAIRQSADPHAVSVEDLVGFRCLIEGHAVRVAPREPDEKKLGRAQGGGRRGARAHQRARRQPERRGVRGLCRPLPRRPGGQ